VTARETPKVAAGVLVDALLEDGRALLRAAPHRPPPREASLLLGHVLGWSEAEVLTRGAARVDAATAARFGGLIARRATGEPVAYLLGEREFFGRRFEVDRRVLIPRPETEHLVEAALALPLPPAPRLLDVGTGSGCIAVTLALELPAARVVASDVSPAALAVARANAAQLAPERVHLAATDLDAALSFGPFDLVISNPPYIGRDEAASLSPEVVAFEPAGALFSPGERDTILRRLLVAAQTLRRGAFMVLEIGFGQAPALTATLAPDLLLREVRRDYAGIPRVLVLERR
jgi:release factor glutamine methyltransferase